MRKTNIAHAHVTPTICKLTWLSKIGNIYQKIIVKTKLNVYFLKCLILTIIIHYKKHGDKNVSGFTSNF